MDDEIPRFNNDPLNNDYLALELFNNSDLLSVNGPDVHNLEKLPSQVFDKLYNSQFILSKESWIIDVGRYNDIYITSDIHADLRTFIYLLIGAGIIGYPLGNTEIILNNILTMDLIPDSVITDIEWIPDTPTLIVIVGDLIDGQRGPYSIYDKKGNIEILLHMFIYNLRVKAREKGSEVRFTLGNHDCNILITEDSLQMALKRQGQDETQVKVFFPNLMKFINDYVHASAKDFFKLSSLNRTTCLLPFYRCCPYFAVSIGNEIICVHGGLNDWKGFPINMIQESIRNDINNFESFCAFPSIYRDDNSFLWSRFYSKEPSAVVCESLNTNPYKLTVVGHCTTTYPYKHHEEILDKYTTNNTNRCGMGGCVLVGCDKDKRIGPRLAIVDIGMSSAFGNNKDRISEFLFLTHKDTTKQSYTFYNKIVRMQVNYPLGLVPITEWEEHPTSGGSKTKKRSKNKKSKKTNAKKTNAKSKRLYKSLYH
jgi:hypothetical protein